MQGEIIYSQDDLWNCAQFIDMCANLWVPDDMQDKAKHYRTMLSAIADSKPDGITIHPQD